MFADHQTSSLEIHENSNAIDFQCPHLPDNPDCDIHKNNSEPSSSASATCDPNPCHKPSSSNSAYESHQLMTSIEKSPISRKEFSPWKSIRAHFIKFCETTSLRGVPKVVRVQSTRLRILWASFVFTFFLGCIVCLVLITLQYLSYDVMHHPKAMFNQPRPFPSVSFCNLRPFSTSGVNRLKSLQILPVEDYISRIRNSQTHLRNKLNDEQIKVVTTSWSMTNYLVNLPNGLEPRELGHTLDDMLVECKVTYQENDILEDKSCHEVGSWRLTQNDIYLNCFTFTATETFITHMLSVQLTLYLGNDLHTVCYDCQRLVMGTQLTGVRLELHSPGTYPRLVEEGIHLLTGTMTKIHFRPREWNMMEPPHGRCSRKVNGTVIHFNGEPYAYTQEACRVQVTEERIRRKCNCIGSFLKVPDFLDSSHSSNMPYCQGINVSSLISSPIRRMTETELNEYLERAHCAHNVSSETHPDGSECPNSCVRYTYDSTISAAQWPAKIFQALMFNAVRKRLQANSSSPSEVLLNSSYSTQPLPPGLEKMIDRLQRSEEVQFMLRNNENETMDQMLEKVNKLNFLENNFLAITVERPDFDIMRLDEKAVVSLTSLLSQIGGLLSIWIGLTFVCIVEVLELFLNIYDSLQSKQAPPKPVRKRGSIWWW